MKILLLVSLMLILPLFVMAQDFNEQQIRISSNSNINIYGDAGVADFTCDFNISNLQQPISVSYNKENSTIEFRETELILENKGFDCGNRSRNKDFNEMVLTERYPQMKLTLNKVTQINENEAMANVDIFIAGKENNYEFPVKITPTPDLEISAQFKINIRDFDLEPISKMFGLVKIDEIIEINLDLSIENLN